jgi:hypothetical protein
MKPKLLTNSDLFIAFFMINRVRYYSFTNEELDFIPLVSLRTGINCDIKCPDQSDALANFPADILPLVFCIQY